MPDSTNIAFTTNSYIAKISDNQVMIFVNCGYLAKIITHSVATINGPKI